ncbi:transcriptional regulator [Arenicella chitinivorans]|uniref:Transcriptional regulator n=1 Tax=Arenicella chitinivorans TaxID=1329800 RepID=A0A918S3D1_9GAMM|nr:LysR family transcriptional regulator [Arenicella chitinivorans]GHA21818.1 transcriptional regulator [Arenicella chitinivorans]
MDIFSLQAFIAVARYASFSKASESLFVTQPAVSKRVSALEEELGTQLFNRIARQISLTEAGKQLLPRAQELVSQADDMQRFASTLSDEISGNLAIAIAHHIGLHRMPPILKQFHQRYPNVHLDILFEDSDKAFHAVQQGDIEFAIITLPSELPDQLSKQLIWHDPLQIVVGLDHPLARSDKITLAELATHSCVLPSEDTETHKIVRRQFHEHDLSLSVQMETNNLETLRMLAEAGLGWSVLPITMHSDSLQRLNIGVNLSRDLGLVVHAKRSLSNAANALRDLVFEQAEPVLT